MKTFLLITISTLSFNGWIFTQEQFVSESINHDVYEDAGYKIFLQSSNPFEFPMTITWDYSAKSVLFMASDGTEWLSATWKTEVNPETITTDENNRFLFDPAKNELKMKVLRIYVNGDGSFTYKIEADKQKIEIYGIQRDDDGDGFADGSEEITEGSENYSDAESIEGDVNGATSVYLNLSNSTDYTIYLATNVQNESGEWVLSNNWIAIESGQSEMIGTTYSDHFYYYAYCKDSKGEFVIWEGTDQYNPVGNSDGSYGFVHVSLSDGAFDDDGEVWFMQLTLEGN